LYFILFVSSGLDMCGRLNSQWRIWHSATPHTGVDVNELIQFDLNFASFNAPYNPVRLMCDKRPANIQCLILRLVTRCTLWSEKYGKTN